MSITNFLGHTFEDEHDQDMTYQLGSGYKYIKSKYPNAYKLPKEELQTMINTLLNSGDTIEEGEKYLEKYIQENEPEWQEKFFGGDSLYESPEMSFGGVDYSKIPAGSYRIAQNGGEVQVQQPQVAQNGGGFQVSQPDINPTPQQKEELIDDFYQNLKRDGVEGYYRQLYCDPVGLETVGAGLRTFTPENLKNYTITSSKEPVSATNPDWPEDEKIAFGKNMQKMCESYCQDWDVNEKGNKSCKKWKFYSPEDQVKQYEDKYDTPAPYFQDDDLEAKSKKYVRQTILPHTEKQFKNLGKNFYNYNREAQKAFMDIPYTTGPNNFLLDPNGTEAKNWPEMSKGIVADDMAKAARESRRGKVGEFRNDWTGTSILHGLDK